MSTERETIDIPEEDVKEVMEAYNRAGCDPVTKHKQDNHLWTVKAVCPDK